MKVADVEAQFAYVLKNFLSSVFYEHISIRFLMKNPGNHEGISFSS